MNSERRAQAQTPKPCGNVHAWCGICRPDISQKLRGQTRGIEKRLNISNGVQAAYERKWNDGGEVVKLIRLRRRRFKQEKQRTGYKSKNGRPYVRLVTGWVPLSHAVWVAHNGLPPAPGFGTTRGCFVIHHVNHNPFDDQVENLDLLTAEEHISMHRARDWIKRRQPCVYLSGGMFKLTDEEMTGWRQYAIEQLRQVNIETRDPTRSFGSLDCDPEPALYFKRDKFDIELSDIVFANLASFSVGTLFEIAWAELRRKLIVAFIPTDSPYRLHPFLNATCVIFDKFLDAVSYIKSFSVSPPIVKEVGLT